MHTVKKEKRVSRKIERDMVSGLCRGASLRHLIRFGEAGKAKKPLFAHVRGRPLFTRSLSFFLFSLWALFLVRSRFRVE